jgi:hypothetical protein
MSTVGRFVSYNDHNDNEEVASVASSFSGKQKHFTDRARRDYDRQNARKERAVAEITALAARETKLIRRWKLCLVIALFVTAALVASGTYMVLSHDEDQNYHDAVSCFTTNFVSFLHIALIWLS